MSLEESECHGHYLPPKKRKTSADSGFDDSGEEDEEDDDDYEEDIENSLAAGTYDMNRRYRCNIKPLDAVDVIAIINGKEDSRCKGKPLFQYYKRNNKDLQNSFQTI